MTCHLKPRSRRVVARSVPAPVTAPPSSAVPRSLGLTAVQFSILWLVGLAYWAFTSPAGMEHFPAGVAWIIVSVTIYALVIVGIRFPIFGLCVLWFIQGLCGWRGGSYYGRYRRW